MNTSYPTPEDALEAIAKAHGPLTKLEMRFLLTQHFPADRFETAFKNLVKDSILIPHQAEPGVPTGDWALA